MSAAYLLSKPKQLFPSSPHYHHTTTTPQQLPPPTCHNLTTAGDYYIIPRPDGTVILGGCKLLGHDSLSPSIPLARTILEHCYALCPALDGSGQQQLGIQGIDVLRHNVGLRPSRRGGPRLEKETVPIPVGKGIRPANPSCASDDMGQSGVVVHAYGIGGAGYQVSGPPQNTHTHTNPVLERREDTTNPLVCFQSSWGMAQDVLKLVDDTFASPPTLP